MRPIIDYEQEYLLSEDGSVYRVGSKRPLVQSVNPQNGYLYVALWKNNQGKTFSVHRLVARHFISNPEGKPFVNHIDSNRQNPHMNNLEWCTQSENIQHGYDYGYMFGRPKFTEYELRLHLESFLSGITITRLAEILGCGISNLSVDLRRMAIKDNRLTEYISELAAQKRKRNTAANASKQLRVHMCTDDGTVLKTFVSLTAAAKYLEKRSSGPISNALNPNHSQKKAYGYLWKLD